MSKRSPNFYCKVLQETRHVQGHNDIQAALDEDTNPLCYQRRKKNGQSSNNDSNEKRGKLQK